MSERSKSSRVLPWPKVARPRDRLGRPLHDLRISVMDRCNFRCSYCMPRETFHERYEFLKSAERLSFAEITRIAAQTNFDVEESAERFQRDLARLGIDAELRRAGIQAGDLVRIGSTELEWEYDPWEAER